jgi:hypothetical protein
MSMNMASDHCLVLWLASIGDGVGVADSLGVARGVRVGEAGTREPRQAIRPATTATISENANRKIRGATPSPKGLA